MRAIRVDEFGGPEVLRVAEVAVPEPNSDEVLVRVTRAGINFADTHERSNSYVAKTKLPFVPGVEVAGQVVRDAGGFQAGQRVVASVPHGGYAEYAVAPVNTTFEVPEGVPDEVAVALLIQGLTAWHVLRTVAHLADGETVVVHAAAGGVGHLALQVAALMGAGRVIATASSEAKRQVAADLGADVVVDVGHSDLGNALREANDGSPVDVVIEMAGGQVFEESLAALAPLGRLVVCGIASRQSNRVSSGRLLRTSATVAGIWIHHLLPDRRLTEEPFATLAKWAGDGRLDVLVGETVALEDVRRAHAQMESRRTAGKLLIDPSR